ncbi:MAG: porin family protein [Elusimicrobiaceae bacterium]|nr:porin family protein [Elusimicrobiaceae bacterium]
MKKIIFLFVALFCGVPAFCQMERGQHLLGGRLGLGFQLENSGVSYSSANNRVDWGSLGAEGGLSYYYLVTDNIGLGADVSYGDFEGGDLFVSSDKVDDKTKLFNAMLSARFTANPTNPFRLYMPVGIGLTVARQDMRIKKGGIDFAKKATDTSFAWFIGAGFEFDLGRESGWSMGFETRYNTFRYDTEKLTRNAPSGVEGDGNRRLSYMSFHMQVNKRF